MSSERATPPVRLSGALAERARARFPLPIADAVAALDCAENAHQRRDRVVECFRTVIRYHAALALSARVQYGPGPGGDRADLQTLLRALRRRHLTDGQWVQLTRTLLRPWAEAPDGHPLSALVAILCGPKGRRPPLGKHVDGLLKMRRTETVAHGGTGGADEIQTVLARRIPQLEAILDALGTVWDAYRPVSPLSRSVSGQAPIAWLLTGDTPAHGRWRRIELNVDETFALTPGHPVLIDADHRPLLSLYPVAMFRRPSPETAEELFLLDGGGRRGTRYVAFPSLAEHRESELWPALEPLLTHATDESEEPVSGIARPYRGLHGFSAEHAALFFGRERASQQLANRVRRYPFITVIGQSGSGKSSLLYAGVFPRLDGYRVVSVRPGRYPTRALATRLDAVLGCRHGERGFSDVLKDSPETLGVVLERACRALDVRVVLAVDQAEELFTLCGDQDERTRFADALASVGYDPDGPMRVVLSLREDFFARLATLAPLCGLYSRQVDIVTTPDRDALLRTLYAPAAAFGYQPEDDALFAAMVEPMVGEPAALALLQFCADQLWELRDRTWKRFTWSAYRRLGGVEGALATHAEAVLERFSPAQRRVARHVFMRLCTAERTRAVVARIELSSCTGDRAAAETVVDQLIDSRLLTVREGQGDDAGAIELVHEALIGHWGRLREWLDDDRELLVVRHRVASAANEWHSEGRGGDFLLGDGKPIADAQRLLTAHPALLSEREHAFIQASGRRVGRRARLKRAAIIGLIALAAATTGAALWAVQQTERASARERDAARRSDDLILMRAGESVDTDAAQALAWLRTLELDERTAPQARMITADAIGRGRTTRLLRFGDRAPVRLQLDEDRLLYFEAGARGFMHTFDGRARRALTSARAHPFTHLEIDSAWRYATVTSDGEVSYADLRSETERTLSLKIPKPLQAYPAANGRRVAILDHHGALWVVDLAGDGGTPRQVFKGPVHPSAPLIALGGDGRVLVHVSADGRGAIIDIDDQTHQTPARVMPISRPDVVRGSDTIVTAETDNSSALLVPADSISSSEPMTTRASSDAVAGLSPDGSVVVIADSDSGVRVVETATGASRLMHGFDGVPQRISFSRDGRRFMVVRERYLSVWEGLAAIQRMPIDTLQILCTAISDDGMLVAAGTDTGAVHVWDTKHGHPIVLRGHRDAVIHVDFDPYGERLATSSLDRDVRVWQLPSERTRVVGASTFSFRRYEQVRVTDVGDIVAATATDVHVFDANGQRTARWPSTPSDSDSRGADDPMAGTIPSFDGPEHSVVLGSDGALAVALGAAAELWRVGDAAVTRLVVADDDVRRLGAAISPRGVVAVFRTYDPAISIVTTSGARVTTLAGTAPKPGDAVPTRTLAFSPDGRSLVEVDGRGSVKRWSTETWSEDVLMTIDHSRRQMRLGAPAFSQESVWLAVPDEADIALWRLDDGARTALRAHDGTVTSVAFSPTIGGTTMLASFGGSSSIRLWNVRERTSRVLAVSSPQKTGVFASDARTLVTLGLDGIPILWDIKAGRRRALPIPANKLSTVAVSRDGQMIVGGSDQGAIHLWHRDVPEGPTALERYIADAAVIAIDRATGQLAATPAE